MHFARKCLAEKASTKEINLSLMNILKPVYPAFLMPKPLAKKSELVNRPRI